MQRETKPRDVDEAALQRAVLSLVVATYPTKRDLSISAIEKRLGRGSVAGAVQVLVRVGLLEGRSASIRPSLATLHVEQLERAWLRQL